MKKVIWNLVIILNIFFFIFITYELKIIEKNINLISDAFFIPIKSNRKDYHSIFSKESIYIRIENYKIAKKIAEIVKNKGWIIVTAESVSGGIIASTFSRVPGASNVFAGGVVCYKIEAKRKLLNIKDTKESELYDNQTAKEMAEGVKKLFEVKKEDKNIILPQESYRNKPIISIATTGRAVTYPKHWEGGVYVGISLPNGKTYTQYFPHNFILHNLTKDRARTKEEGMLIAANKALKYMLKIIKEIK